MGKGKKRRAPGVDRRPRTRDAEEQVQEEAEDEPPPAREREPPVDVVAFCSACGTNDASLFSKRMLERRGRHGDRTRRCRECIEGGHFGDSNGQPDIFVPTSVLHSALAVKSTASAPSRWEAAEEAAKQSARSYKAVQAAAHASRAVHDKQAQARSLVSDHEAAVHGAGDETGGAADIERQRRKIRKALRLISELKERRASGEKLEASQELKISRENALRSDLRSLEEGYVFLMPGKEEEEDESEPVAAPHGQVAKAAKRSRLDEAPEEDESELVAAPHRQVAKAGKRSRFLDEAPHKSATFTESGSGRNPLCKKAEGPKAARQKAVSAPRCAPADPAFAELLSHMQSVKSLYG